ncbi:MAG: RelA/SpoT family protein, partial [Patescibacteria group bacterium]
DVLSEGCQMSVPKTSKILYNDSIMPDWISSYSETSVVRKAYALAEEAHRDATRESGDPYITHSIAVAKTVRGWHLDEASIAAALLHDVVEDTHYTNKEIEKRFGAEIAFLVGGLTKLDSLQYPKEERDIENLRKLILSFSKDLRVLIIKLADRLHNMQTIRHLPEPRQIRMSWETSEIYSPLAYRLGMQRLSGELEDLAFPYVHPEEFAWLMKAVKDSFADRVAYAEKLRPVIEKLLNENGVRPVRVDARAKHYASLYKKLLRYDMNLDKIHDLVALRIIVHTVEECYTALGIIHKLWQPVPKQFDDYIARPKPNGYRSLHTTVFCVDNKITEFQIRTEEMHEEAELGIAAHWAYQQIKSSKYHALNWKGVTSRRELIWVEQLRNWQKTFTDGKEFLESLKIDFFKERIFALTPQNDVIDLPVGATPVDFAYRIHSQLGNACVGAKINGKIVPLSHPLHSGDVVEILTQRGKLPSESWLQFVKTSFAKKYIRSFFLKKHREEAEEEPHMEFKIVYRDARGFLKDITGIFPGLKVAITHLNTHLDKHSLIGTITIHCDVLPKERIEKILLRIKNIPHTKEVSYKFQR